MDRIRATHTESNKPTNTNTVLSFSYFTDKMEGRYFIQLAK